MLLLLGVVGALGVTLGAVLWGARVRRPVRAGTVSETWRREYWADHEEADR